MRIHTISLKGAEKRGVPKFGSDMWEVQLTGELEPGEDLASAMRALKQDVRAGLALAWVSGVPEQAVKAAKAENSNERPTGEQRRELQTIMERCAHHGIGIQANPPRTRAEAYDLTQELKARLSAKGAPA